MRKNTSLKTHNKIGIYYDTQDDDLNRVIEKYSEKLTEDLIYPALNIKMWNKTENVIVEEDTEINDKPIRIVITDVAGDFKK